MTFKKNPGPFMFNIDPSKTIEAPYSQGDAIDGQNRFTEKPWLKMSFQRTFDRKHHSQKSLPKIIVAKTVMRKTSWNKMCIKMSFSKICAKKT